MKFLVVDDHDLFCQGLTLLIESIYQNIQVLTVPSCESAVSRYQPISHEIDLVFMDLGLLGVSNAMAVDMFRQAMPLVPVIILTASEDYAEIQLALSKGAMGFVPKYANRAVLQLAVETVLQGNKYIYQLPAATVPVSVIEALTTRQKDIIRSLIKGKPNKLIARELDISENTVRAHLRTIYKELETQNRTETVHLALMEGYN